MLSDQEHIHDDQLQMYFDAELGDGESTIVRRHLVGCSECKGRLRAMEQLHSFFEMAAEDVSTDLPSEELFAKIKAGLAESKPGLKTIEGGRATPAPATGLKRSAWVPIAVGFAVAAAVLIGVIISTENDDDDVARPVPPRRAPEVLVQEVPVGTSVHDVDFGENTGTVFQVEGDDGGSLAVVWINDDVPGEDSPEEVPQ